MANRFGDAASLGETATAAQSAIDDALDFPANSVPKTTTTEDAPKAYINYMFFDEEMSFITSGFKQITTAAQLANSFTRSYSEPQKSLYQGKEKQEELDTYDFEWRMYDPLINRTWQLDPHAESYYSVSPYSWAANNPLQFIDPDGRDIVGTDGKPVTYRMENSKPVWSANASSDVKRVGNALLRTGTSQLNKSISSDVKISISVSDKSVKTKSGFLAGKTKYSDVTRSKSTGEYKAGSAEVTIYEGSIENLISGEGGSNDFSESGVNQEGGVGAVAGHELEHATNSGNVDQAYKNKLEGQKNDVEAAPNAVHKQILKEEKVKDN